MEELIFQKVQKGDMIFTLEKDRRSGYLKSNIFITEF